MHDDTIVFGIFALDVFFWLFPFRCYGRSGERPILLRECDNLSGVYRGYAILLSCPYIFLIQHICLFSSPLILPLSQEIVYKCIHFMESGRFMIERNAIKKDNIGLKQLFRLKSSHLAAITPYQSS